MSHISVSFNRKASTKPTFDRVFSAVLACVDLIACENYLMKSLNETLWRPNRPWPIYAFFCALSFSISLRLVSKLLEIFRPAKVCPLQYFETKSLKAQATLRSGAGYRRKNLVGYRQTMDIRSSRTRRDPPLRRRITCITRFLFTAALSTCHRKQFLSEKSHRLE